jgi:hypothetical protein
MISRFEYVFKRIPQLLNALVNQFSHRLVLCESNNAIILPDLFQFVIRRRGY